MAWRPRGGRTPPAYPPSTARCGCRQVDSPDQCRPAPRGTHAARKETGWARIPDLSPRNAPQQQILDYTPRERWSSHRGADDGVLHASRLSVNNLLLSEAAPWCRRCRARLFFAARLPDCSPRLLAIRAVASCWMGPPPVILSPPRHLRSMLVPGEDSPTPPEPAGPSARTHTSIPPARRAAVLPAWRRA